MIAFDGMLIGPAKQAGIPVPDDLDNFESDNFVQWVVFRNVQIGESMPYPSAAWDNAKVVAQFTPEQLKTTVTYKTLLDAGLAVGNSSVYN